MKKEKFLELMDSYGIDLKELSIGIDAIIVCANSHGVFEKDNEWHYYYMKKNGQIKIVPMKSEDVAFDKMYSQVFHDLKNAKYTDSIINDKIAKIKKSRICSFLQQSYRIKRKDAEDIWDFLKKDMRILFEFKYCAGYGEFPPESIATEICGYTAEKIFREKEVAAVGAFTYLVYLKENLAEAEANLTKEKDRKKAS